jgi:enoyl-CoA hydratase/carnithine racemase
MSERVTVEHDGGVAHVRLARPDKINALDAAMFEALVEVGDALRGRADVRCIVLSGEGKGFCAGLDVASFGQMMAEPEGLARMFELHPDSPANRAQQVAWTWQQQPVPVVAAIHGACFGGGLQIALGADMRLVHPEAKLSVMEIKWGLVPDMSGTQTLRQLMPLDVAKELTFTGRVVSGDEAVALRLATRSCDDPLAAALELARTIAGRSPDAVRAAKRLLNDGWRADLKTGLALEAELQRGLIGSPNQMEAVMANMQKRDPQFSDPS